MRNLGTNGKLYPRDIKLVSMLGCTETIKWEQTPEGMVVHFPKVKPSDFAYVIKICRE